VGNLLPMQLARKECEKASRKEHGVGCNFNSLIIKTVPLGEYLMEGPAEWNGPCFTIECVILSGAGSTLRGFGQVAWAQGEMRK
jgi:hypothetical protein